MGTCNICLESLLQRSPEADTQKQGTEEAAGTANLSSLVSATPCGHVFHTVCVTQWLQQEEQHPLGQQQQHCCPQCRRPVSVGTLVKLFLDHEGSDSGLGGKDGNKRPKQRKRTGNTNKKEKIVVRTKVNLPGSSGSSDRGSSEDVRERLIRSEREKEENRIIQDVLQCQLEDLESEYQKLRKHLAVIEDQLHEKVTEVSGLEAELLGARNQLQKATQGEEDKIPAEKVRDLRRDFAALERNNDALRAQVFHMRQEIRTKDLEIREKTQRLEEAEERVRASEEAARGRPDLMDRLQNELEDVHRTDIYSIYETVDEETTVPRNSRIPRVKGNRNCCSCVKATVTIVVLLTIFLALFVALPLKLIFSEKKLPVSTYEH